MHDSKEVLILAAGDYSKNLDDPWAFFDVIDDAIRSHLCRRALSWNKIVSVQCLCLLSSAD